MKQQQEAALLAAFRLMNEKERETFLDAAEFHTEGRRPKKPRLILLCGGASKTPDSTLAGNLG